MRTLSLSLSSSPPYSLLLYAAPPAASGEAKNAVAAAGLPVVGDTVVGDTVVAVGVGVVDVLSVVVLGSPPRSSSSCSRFLRAFSSTKEKAWRRATVAC